MTDGRTTRPRAKRANGGFRRFAQRAVEWSGTAAAFACAVAVILVWLISGPFLGFSVVWWLLINTFANAATFLMVFLIRNAQGRDARALQLKLDELIRTQKGARNILVDLEHLPDEELRLFEDEFRRFREREAARFAIPVVETLDASDLPDAQTVAADGRIVPTSQSTPQRG